MNSQDGITQIPQGVLGMSFKYPVPKTWMRRFLVPRQYPRILRMDGRPWNLTSLHRRNNVEKKPE
jgi:hypothetical protein